MSNNNKNINVLRKKQSTAKAFQCVKWRHPSNFGAMAKRAGCCSPAAGPGEAHLDTLLVALEEVGARVPGAVPFEKLLSKPAVEALVVLSLHVSASLPDAVHGDGSCCDGDAL